MLASTVIGLVPTKPAVLLLLTMTGWAIVRPAASVEKTAPLLMSRPPKITGWSTAMVRLALRLKAVALPTETTVSPKAMPGPLT